LLPKDYSLIVAKGIGALGAVEAPLRARAASSLDPGPLWIRVRDVKSLAGRLESEDDWAWQTGFARSLLSPRDLGVLEEAASDGEVLPYDDAPAISALLTFLTRYLRGDFPYEDAKTFPQSSNSPAG